MGEFLEAEMGEILHSRTVIKAALYYFPIAVALYKLVIRLNMEDVAIVGFDIAF